jgi:hypothetical protein
MHAKFFFIFWHAMSSLCLYYKTFYCSEFTRKRWTRMGRLPKDKHSSLLRKSVNYGRKKFYSIALSDRKAVYIYIYIYRLG